MKIFYVYLHCRPDGIPFYVGKGSGNRANDFYKRNPYHRNIVTKYGAENILVGKLDCSSEEIAFELEKGLIKCLRSGSVKLANLTGGGEGPSGYTHTEEEKSKIGNCSKIQWEDPVIRFKRIEGLNRVFDDPAILAKRNKAITSAWNHPDKDESRRKISERHKHSIWITDGVNSERIKLDAVIPEGWYRGRPESHAERVRAGRRNMSDEAEQKRLKLLRESLRKPWSEEAYLSRGLKPKK